MKTKKIMYIVLSILIPLIIGFIGSMLGGSMALFDNIQKPIFAPPAIIFPIVWGILYILMGISSYLVYISDSVYKKNRAYILCYPTCSKCFMDYDFL